MNNVLLVQVDGNLPNLALMKLSAWHKGVGDNVYLDECPTIPDIVYVSAIFSESKEEALLQRVKYPHSKVIIGGSAVDKKLKLPNYIEHLMPDYSLYDGKICTNCNHLITRCACRREPQPGNIDFSMGFSSRGCFRNCDFCIVREKEGFIHDNAPISEFHHPDHDKLVLYDNNFLASPKWRENLQFLIDRKIKTSFNQGNDIRLINKENAELLSQVKYYDYKFKNRRLYFAFDDVSMKKEVINGIELLMDSGIKPNRLMFYMLMDFNSTFDEDYERFNILSSFGIKPYVMIYNKNSRNPTPIVRHFARWVNGRFYNIFPFEVYDSGTSQIHIQQWLSEK